MGLEVFFALVANGVGIGASLTAVYGIIGAGVIQLGAQLLLNSAIAALTSRSPQQQNLKRDLAFPTSRPSKRFNYGEYRSAATVLPYPTVGQFGYACWLLNSRESEGEFTIYFDNREVELTGDPYDFSETGGATATNAPFLDHVTIWIGRGEQTQPPQVFLDEAGYVDGGDELLWKASDAGTGLTMVWAKLKAGANGQRNERWPGAVPQLEVFGKWSKVYDPREMGHVESDASTWAWSDNPFLCGLDLARRNPFRPYDLRNLEMDLWESAADAADETVALKSGGSEPRYRTAGVVVFDGSEIETLMEPLIASGGGRLTRSGGQLGVVAGVPRTTAVTISDSLGGLAYSGLREDAELITELRVNYSPSERGGEPGELIPWEIPGALAADGGQPSVTTLDLSMVPSATQAQRIRNITGRENRLQRRLSLVAPPVAFRAVPGSVVNVNLPMPYGAKMNGLYEVKAMSPMLDPVGRDGFALRCPVELSEYAESVFDWDRLTDEEPVVHPPYDGTRDGVGVPGAISVITGSTVDLDTGGTVVPRILFRFDPPSVTTATSYEWQYREDELVWSPGGAIDGEVRDGDGKVFGYVVPISITSTYDIRVRTIAESGFSDWVYIYGVTHGLALSDVSGTRGLGAASFSGMTASDANFGGIRIYRAEIGEDFEDAALVLDTVALEPGVVFAVTAGDAATSNLFANSDFADGSAWSVGTGWVISSGQASHSGGVAGSLYQSPSMTGAAVYRWAASVTSFTDGVAVLRIEGDTNVSGEGLSAVGDYIGAVTAPANPVSGGIRSSAAFVGAVDDVIMFEQTPDCLPQGDGLFWVVVVTKTGSEGEPGAPITLTII